MTPRHARTNADTHADTGANADSAAASVAAPPGDAGHTAALTVSACAAVGVPALLAANAAPSATFWNQAAALVGWGGLIGVLALVQSHTSRDAWPRGPRSAGFYSLLGAFVLLLIAALAAMPYAQLPSSLALSNAGMIAAAAATLWVAASLGPGLDRRAFQAFCIALVAAGLLSSLVSFVQVFIPSWADGNLIAPAAVEGRAGANLRQPNHLSSLLLWSLVGLLFWVETGGLRRSVAAVLTVVFVAALVLSASRTGTIGILMLALWGVLDRRLSRGTRLMLMASPLLYGVLWAGFGAWAHEAGHAFAGERSFKTQGDISSSRFGIWANAWALVKQHPWAGVGFGDFNFAWTLTPFPQRPVAFFDHTHNLPLNFAVELGLPLAALVLALMLHALWRAFAAGHRAPGERGLMLRSAFVMVLLVSVHSLLEYPLWYAYFLLPTAFAFGLCLGPRPDDGAPTAAPLRARGVAGAAAVALVLGGLGALLDYARVIVIFQPGDSAAPLAERIADGQRSVLFAHHADYAAATTAPHPSQAMPSFSVATHYLLDTRLMIAWAMALAEAGDVERARHLAQRLREFHHADSDEFFAPCDAPAPPGVELPFQCTPPARAFDYRDFR